MGSRATGRFSGRAAGYERVFQARCDGVSRFRITARKRASERVQAIIGGNGWPGRLFGTPRDVTTTEHDIRLADWPQDAPPLRIAFASDFHAGPTTHPDLWAAACDALESARPDIVLVGGDFVVVEGPPRRRACRTRSPPHSVATPCLGIMITTRTQSALLVWSGTSRQHHLARGFAATEAVRNRTYRDYTSTAFRNAGDGRIQSTVIRLAARRQSQECPCLPTKNAPYPAVTIIHPPLPVRRL